MQKAVLLKPVKTLWLSLYKTCIIYFKQKKHSERSPRHAEGCLFKNVLTKSSNIFSFKIFL